jgi:D-aminoacyl-tRNA deacylase
VRAVLQRVRRGEVRSGDDTLGSIGAGLVVFVGVERGDGTGDAEALSDKVATLRIFQDDDGRMNRSVEETGGALLVVSQFTLLADTRRGRRPSFEKAAAPAEAEALYDRFVAALRARGLTVATGRFGAMMEVGLVNDGPVTILLDSREASGA